MTRVEVEEFLYQEAALLDAWRLDEWLQALFTIADDIHRIRARVQRLKDPHAHAEHPPSRTRRIISNVRIVEKTPLRVEANFIVYRFRRNENVREYVGHYKYVLKNENGKLRIARREAILDRMELASLGAVSFIL